MNITTRDLKPTDTSIKEQLKNIPIEKAICEYVWNGFDANASVVNFNYQINELDTVSNITISDNGNGISFDNLENTFDLFLDSNKKNSFNSNNKRKKRPWSFFIL